MGCFERKTPSGRNSPIACSEGCSASHDGRTIEMECWARENNYGSAATRVLAAPHPTGGDSSKCDANRRSAARQQAPVRRPSGRPRVCRARGAREPLPPRTDAGTAPVAARATSRGGCVRGACLFVGSGRAIRTFARPPNACAVRALRKCANGSPIARAIARRVASMRRHIVCTSPTCTRRQVADKGRDP